MSALTEVATPFSRISTATSNPQDRAPFHVLFVRGATTPARMRLFVDFLVERLGTATGAP